jgi:hypothetical protein
MDECPVDRGELAAGRIDRNDGREPLESRRFDELARVMSSSTSRRTAIRLFLTGAAASLLAVTRQPADAATRRGAGLTCREDANCYSGDCLPPDSRGRRVCGCEFTLQVPANTPVPTGTGLNLKKGDKIQVRASGTAQYCDVSGCDSTPNGVADSECPQFGCGALLAGFGDKPFEFAGAGPVTLTATGRGELSFLYGDNSIKRKKIECPGCYADNSGSYTVVVSLVRGNATCPSTPI